MFSLFILMFIIFPLLIILFRKLQKKYLLNKIWDDMKWVIKLLLLLLLLFVSALAGYWTVFCSNSIPMAVNGGVKKCSHACGGRIHSLQSSDFCSDWDTSSQPTHCRNIHFSYLQIFSRAFFSRISCQTLLFPLSLKPSRCPCRELSGRLWTRSFLFLWVLVVTGDCWNSFLIYSSSLTRRGFVSTVFAL